MQAAVLQTAPRERELTSLSVFTVTVVLATVTMTFGAMIAIFLERSEGAMFWSHIHMPVVFWATTAILLASSGVLETARRRLLRQEQTAFFRLTAWAAGLGALFLAGQIVGWLQILGSGVVLNRNPHPWFIFLFTGLHGIHILVGLAALGYLLYRTRVPASGPKYQMYTRVITAGVSIFWHYLDFIWLVLFGLLLFWRP